MAYVLLVTVPVSAAERSASEEPLQLVRHAPALMAVGVLGVSLVLAAVTPLPYIFNDHGTMTLVLFTFGLGGEGNVGAWWSGVLFLLAAAFALDRAADGWRRLPERHGWGALAAALALLSFDELAWLHELIMARDPVYLAPLGLLGAMVLAYALANLRRAGIPIGKLTAAFALLATVPLQAYAEAALTWRDPLIYGLRALLEEGTELAAALLLVAATSGGRFHSGAQLDAFASLERFARPLLWLAVAALPAIFTAAYTFNMSGAANWLGAALFLGCALLTLRRAAPGDGAIAFAAAAWYLLASLGSNAVRPDWDPVALGLHVNVRGMYFGALLLAAPWVLAAGAPWRQRGFWLALAGCTLAAGFLLVRPQIVWSTWPPTIALLCFYIETFALRTRAAVARKPVPRAAAPVPAAGRDAPTAADAASTLAEPR